MSDRPAGILDDPVRLKGADPDGMLARVEHSADQWDAACSAADLFETPRAWRGLKGVVVSGMGGSAIAADLASAWLARRGSVPVDVVRDYSLPAWAGPDRLFVACSYSGNTEETLSAWDEALTRGMSAAVITTGGRLAEEADRAGVPRLALAPGSPPRAALAGALPTLLKVLDGVGDPIEGLGEALRTAGEALRAGVRDFGPDLIASENPAKSLALWLDRELPIIYAPTWPLGPVAVRWRGQFAENAKRLSFGHTLPEMNHNEIVGWSAQEDLYPRMRVILLEDGETGDRTALRARLTADMIRQAGAPVRVYRGEGEGLLARMMHLVCLADFASVYLALGWGIDPTPVTAIDHLKQRLAEESS